MPAHQENFHACERVGKVVHFIRCPNLVESAVASFKEQLFELAQRPNSHDLYLDFSKVNFLTARTLGMLITLHRKLADAGGGLVIYNVQECVNEVFEITKLNSFVDIRRKGESTRAGADEPIAGENRTVHGKAKECKVLIVEDNPDTALCLKRFLEGEGRQTDIAIDGEEAIERVMNYRPDIIVLDIGLPKLDGYQVAERIRNLEGDGVRIIAVTGDGEPESLQRAMTAGVDYFLVKPVDPEQLVALVVGA